LWSKLQLYPILQIMTPQERWLYCVLRITVTSGKLILNSDTNFYKIENFVKEKTNIYIFSTQFNTALTNQAEF
jgi:hypothetical protein